jgi:hypothetical protein
VRTNAPLVAGTIGGLAHYSTPETRKITYGVEPVKLFQH